MRPRPGRCARGIEQAARFSSCSSTWSPTRHPATRRCTRNCRTVRRPRPTRTASWRRCCATRSARTPAARMRSAATPTGCSRGRFSVRQSTSTRPTSGVCSSWKPLSPNRSRSPTGSIPGRRSPRRCAGSTTSRAIWSHGTDALQQWMQELSDRAVESLADTHFEIAEPLRNLECRIAPTQTGGIYYTGPSEDLTRPGPDVVVGAAGRRHVSHLAGDDDGLPRGRAGPSSADRPRRGACRPAQPVAQARLLGVGPRRGLGAVRRTTDGRARLARRRR